jgi:hypothetical protein
LALGGPSAREAGEEVFTPAERRRMKREKEVD